MNGLQELLTAASLLESRLRAFGWSFCFIGSPEDLVVHKVFAGRDRNWGDVERILVRQCGKLDLAQIRKELKSLLELKGDPEALNELDHLIGIVSKRLEGTQ